MGLFSIFHFHKVGFSVQSNQLNGVKIYSPLEKVWFHRMDMYQCICLPRIKFGFATCSIADKEALRKKEKKGDKNPWEGDFCARQVKGNYTEHR